MTLYGSYAFIHSVVPFFNPLYPMYIHRPLIQGKLDVLSQAGLSKDDFSKADSTFMKVL